MNPENEPALNEGVSTQEVPGMSLRFPARSSRIRGKTYG
jgi:hypothetical protein